MRATLNRVAMLQNVPEIQHEIMGFCVQFAVVVHMHSQRVTFSDVFIVCDVCSALRILGTCLFGKHRYTEDRAYQGDIRRLVWALSDHDLTMHRIGNNRLFVCSI